MTDDLTPLRRLAHLHGVASRVRDGRDRVFDVADQSLRAILAAMDVPARSDAEVARSLDAAAAGGATVGLPPVLVTRTGRPTTAAAVLPAGTSAGLHVELADGTRRQLPLSATAVEQLDQDGQACDRWGITLPADLPPGDHVLVLTTSGRRWTCPVIGTPRLCPLPARGLWGWTAQLYATRSQTSWGIGDLADLATMLRRAAAQRAAFVLVNPLHAAAPTNPQQPSPYFPASRRFTSPLYLAVEAVAEMIHAPPEVAATVERAAAALRATNRSDRIDRDAVWAHKRAALEALYSVPLPPARARAFRDYRDREGQALERWATYCALAEEHGPRWRAWPEPLRRPDTAAVAAARDERAARVGFHAWLQWQLDGQLAGAQAAAARAGMPIGVIHDLAVGVDPGGADAWSLQDELAAGVTIGAPPDAFNQQGQDWALPPVRPDRLHATAYAPFRLMVRAALRHGGGIRIDHALGLYRQWWVPEGLPPSAGTFVSYPGDDLLAVLAVEAHATGGIVIGEDLGAVEQSVRDALADHGVLGNRIVWFERTPDGHRLPSHAYPEGVLTMVTTHDLPTAAGYWTGAGIRLQAELDLLGDDTSPETELQRAAQDRASLAALLAAEGVLPGGADGDPVDDPAAVAQRVAAVHAFAARTPSRLVGAALADAVGDLHQPNLPGTTDAYPNWRLPLTDPETGAPILLEDLMADPRVAAMARLLTEGRAAARTGEPARRP